jgi:hypothetical protein
MNKLSALALGTALTLSMPLAALAQDADAGVTLDGGVTTELGGEDAGVEADVDAGVDADVDAGVSDLTYGDLDTALQGAGTADLSGVTADTEIEIVDISTLGEDGEFTASAFAETQADYESDINLLRTNVDGNADLVAAVEAAGYTTADVIAVWMDGDAALTVFVETQQSPEAEAAEDATTDEAADPNTDAGLEPPTQGETITQ